MPVVVKTPAAPAVVVVPYQKGEWRIDPTAEDTPHAARAVCHHVDHGQPIGFALVGAATEGRPSYSRRWRRVQRSCKHKKSSI
jgi:rubredoxin-NAD+ reductase